MKRSSTARMVDEDDGVDVELSKLTVTGRGRLVGKARIGLASLRAVGRLTQVDMAARMDVTQTQVSKIEAGEDWRLSTLRRYAEALGGQLEVTVSLGGRRYRVA